MEFGICFAGLEAAMEKYARIIANRWKYPIYLEIGVASGQTLVSVSSIIAQENELGWSSIGLDLADGYSLDREGILQRANSAGLQAVIVELNDIGAVYPIVRSITVFLRSSQDFLANRWRNSIHFALIDGCHGKKCVTEDFVLLERYVPKGGIIAFHDFGQDSVGEPQPHCGSGDTLGACRELGLLDGRRKGWKLIETVIGDKSKTGRDLGVFERL